jgi:undecaprenyl-diphosphatase
MFELLVSIIVGLVQGITEFLPISSTAHNFLVSKLLTKEIDLEISNIIQLGTLIAIIQYYWSDLSVFAKRIVEIIKKPSEFKIFVKNIKSWWKNDHNEDVNLDIEDKNALTDSTIFQLAIATIPIMIIGLTMRSVANNLRSLVWVGFFMIIGAILLSIADWYYNNSKVKKVKRLNKIGVMTIGIFQAFAIFPGMSRSGSCLAGSYFTGVEKQSAIRFAFLLSIPALGISGINDLFSFLKKSASRLTILPDNDATNFSVVSVLIGTFVAYVVGLICLKWLLNYLAKHDFNIFIWYRIIIGFLLIILSGVKL